MPATPIYGLPYPGDFDPPDGPDQVRVLAEAVEPELARIDASLTPTAAIFASGETVEYGDALSGNVASFAFSPTRSALPNIQGTFVAPPSGKVKVHWDCKMRSASDAAAVLLSSFIIRAGATPGSGTIFRDASDPPAIQHTGTTDQGAGRSRMVSGLTPGATYNAQMVWRRSGSADLIVTGPNIIIDPVWK